jgi:hypothetical protein
MASLKFPLSVAEKQQALFVKPLPANELSAWGRTYQDAGQPYDALEFFQAAQDRPAMEACGEGRDGADRLSHRLPRSGPILRLYASGAPARVAGAERAAFTPPRLSLDSGKPDRAR